MILREGDPLISVSECMSASTGVTRLHDPLATLQLSCDRIIYKNKSPASVADISGRIKV